MTTCGCGHPKGAHVAGLKGCRFNGCSCEAFRDPDATSTVAPGSRTVAIEIPDGYMLSISLIPYTESPPDDEHGAGGEVGASQPYVVGERGPELIVPVAPDGA